MLAVGILTDTIQPAYETELADYILLKYACNARLIVSGCTTRPFPF